MAASRRTSFLSPLMNEHGLAGGSTTREGWRLRNSRTGAVLAKHIELAADRKSRNRGLLGRDRLDAGHALAIVPCSSVHMFFMRFAIDVAFVGRRGNVVKCVHTLKPWRIAWAMMAYAAIELPAGTLLGGGTQRGDRLVVDASAPDDGTTRA